MLSTESELDFSLFTSDREQLNDFESYNRARIIEVPAANISGTGGAGSLAWQQLALPSAILHERLDLVHFPYYLEPALAKSPFIVSILDMDTFLPNDRHSRWTRTYHNSLIRLHARRSSAIITISHHSKQDIIEYLDVPEDKVHVIYCGLTEPFNEAASGGGMKTENMDDTYGEYFLYAGGLGMRKNLKRMVDAFALARHTTRSGASLVITGELADVGQALQDYANTVGYKDFIHFPGHIPDDELPSLYAGSTASIYPSLNEGFGLPVIESMACGAPVITSRDSSMEEIAGGNAILVDPRDYIDIAAAIGALMIDPPLAGNYGKNGPTHAITYSWDKAALQCLELYETVLAQGKAHC
jgi:glycosyltransferase involved in cell wall biosynthesis